jgi:transcription antitermination factor NusG
MDVLAMAVNPCAVDSGPGLTRQWYAVRVKPQHERTVSYSLSKKGFERYVPLYKALRRWSDSYRELDLPIFPGFVFCRLDLLEVASVLSTPAVYQLAMRGGVAVPIEDRQLHTIQRIESAGLPVVPWPFLKEGQEVRIARGPLTGVDGLLASSTKAWHVVVNIQQLQRGVAVAIDYSDIAPLAAAVTA